MQERLHHIATRLVWIQPLVTAVAIAALVAALFFAVAPDADAETWLIPALLLFCWSLLVVTLVSMFRTTPPAADRNTGFFRRQMIRLHRAFRNLLALAFLALSLALIILSYKLLAAGVG